MNKSLYTFSAIFAFGLMSAQVDPKEKDKTMVAKPATDTTSVNQQIQKESDLKTMDAVKTQDHPKPTPVKQPATKKDSVTAKKKKSVK